MSFFTKFSKFYGEALYAKQHLKAFRADVKNAWNLAFEKETIELNGIKLLLDKNFVSDNIIKEMYRGNYEKPETAMLNLALTPSDRVFELGTGLGYNAITAAKIIGAKNVITYEANPGLIDIINRNCALNSQPVQVVNKYLVTDDDARTEAEFYVSKDFWESGSTDTGNRTKITVPTAKLSEELDRFKPTFLVCDIEGGEIFLLKQPLPKYIKRIIIETHPFYDFVGDKANTEFLKGLMDQGFNLAGRFNWGNTCMLERPD
jgi:FkbM family methyltransferase